MKSDNKQILKSYFSNNYQYHIPFFQRSYVWGEDNWSTFYENLVEETDAYEAGQLSEHFIGTLITKQRQSTSFEVSEIELIDGQQRMTTVSIVLKALADTGTGEYANLQKNTNDLVVFEDNRGLRHFRIRHSDIDRKYFEAIMTDRSKISLPNGDNSLLAAYDYFYNKFNGFDDERRNNLVNVLLNRFPVLGMMLDDRDDEQEIFDTINSLGVRLTIGELLKNYIFREESLRELYKETWQATFESDEETVKFWNATKTAGRVKRTNLELLLYSFLIIETGKEVRLEKLYRGYKAYLESIGLEGRKAFLHKLTEYATEYANFPSVADLHQVTISDREKRLFHVIEYLEITTVYPLVLYIYQHTEQGGERNSCLALIESFLVRRAIAGFTTKNYNRLFISWIADFKSNTSFSFETLQNTIDLADKETSHMPSDEEVRRGFRENFLYNKNAREILFFIALHQLTNNRYSDTRKTLLPVTSYSVEHIMPKKWGAHWNRPKLSDADTDARNWWLKRLGNLTLITGNMNSKLRNASWKKKRRALSEVSNLPLTVDYLGVDSWDESSIKSRAEDLAAAGVAIWPSR